MRLSGIKVVLTAGVAIGLVGAGVWLGRSISTPKSGADSTIASSAATQTLSPTPIAPIPQSQPPQPASVLAPSTPAAVSPTAPSSTTASPAALPSPASAEADPALPGQTNLADYFKSLTDANSAVHTVRAGENLTRIAKQFGVTPGLIAAANSLKGDRIYPGQKLRVPKAKFSLLAQKSTNLLHLKADAVVIRSYRIATGKDRSTPEGVFKIINHLKNPTWYYDGKVIPPDSPDNPLGTRWMGFDKEGYGLHGTTRPDEIGQFATLGCVRMLNEDIEFLFELLPVGTEVIVTA